MNTNVVNLHNQNLQPGTPPPSKGKEMGKDDFMKLLMTQLASQDPLNPQDSTAFVSQLTQFANLENLGNLGKKMDQLVQISGASNASNSVSLLGKEVRVEGNQIKGAGSIFYDLPQVAKDAKLEVLDSKGKIVKTMDQIPTSAGLHELKIENLPAGLYSFRIQAMDSGNKMIKANLSTAEKVQAVSFADNTPMLLMQSGMQMKAQDAIEIRQPQTL